jgi:hypothetical protein
LLRSLLKMHLLWEKRHLLSQSKGCRGERMTTMRMQSMKVLW